MHSGNRGPVAFGVRVRSHSIEADFYLGHSGRRSRVRCAVDGVSAGNTTSISGSQPLQTPWSSTTSHDFRFGESSQVSALPDWSCLVPPSMFHIPPSLRTLRSMQCPPAKVQHERGRPNGTIAEARLVNTILWHAERRSAFQRCRHLQIHGNCRRSGLRQRRWRPATKQHSAQRQIGVAEFAGRSLERG